MAAVKKPFNAKIAKKIRGVRREIAVVCAFDPNLQILLLGGALRPQSVSVACIDGNQFQALQQWAGLGDELHVAAARTGQDRMSRVSRSQAGAHQLIAFEPLFAPQAAYGFVIGIGRDAAQHLDGWFHKFLQSGSIGAGFRHPIPSGMSVARQLRQGLVRSGYCRLDGVTGDKKRRRAANWHLLKWSMA